MTFGDTLDTGFNLVQLCHGASAGFLWCYKKLKGVSSCWFQGGLASQAVWCVGPQADYELNAYRRRGGQERLPTPSYSLVSCADARPKGG